MRSPQAENTYEAFWAPAIAEQKHYLFSSVLTNGAVMYSFKRKEHLYMEYVN